MTTIVYKPRQQSLCHLFTDPHTIKDLQTVCTYIIRVSRGLLIINYKFIKYLPPIWSRLSGRL